MTSNHCAALTRDRALFLWGNNNYGQIGNGEAGCESDDDNIVESPQCIMANVKYFEISSEETAEITGSNDLYRWGNYLSKVELDDYIVNFPKKT